MMAVSPTNGTEREREQRNLAAPIEVVNQGEILHTYDGDQWGLEAVIGDVCDSYHESRWAGLDVVLWRNGYAIAAVTQGQDGEPVLTRLGWR